MAALPGVVPQRPPGRLEPLGAVIERTFRTWCARYIDWVDPVFVRLRRDELLREGPFAPAFKERILGAYVQRALGR